MLIKRILLVFTIVFSCVVAPPSNGGDIISCDSFENCPDGSEPLTGALLALQDKMDALEAENAALAASLAAHTVSGDHDTRYYTKTETQTSGSAAVHWNNLTNVPANVADTTSGDALAGQIVKGKKAWVDGAEVTGTKVRFQDNGDGTVTDNDTNLIWLKNANCFGPQGFGYDLSSLGTGHDCSTDDDGLPNLTDGSAPGQWRNPDIGQLWSLVDLHYTGPALSNAAGTGQWEVGDAFDGLPAEPRYWSRSWGDKPNQFYGSVYILSLSVGGMGAVPLTLVADDIYVWPVRAAP